MTTKQLIDYDDVGEACRENRPLLPAHKYRFQFALGNLNFRHLQVADPVPLGRQVLESAGLDRGDDYSLFAILESGDFEDVRLDEPFDLRARGAERFVAFLTDRDYKLTLADRQLEWGKPAISGAALYKLAEIREDEAVFLEVRGGEDQLVERDDLIDLTTPGVERFVIGPKPVATYEIIVNSRPRTVENSDVTYEQVVELAFPGGGGPNICFSMTYRNAASRPHAGELSEGGRVKVKKKGTIFNVTRTDKS